MKSVRVSFLIFLLLEVMCCEGCWTEEKQALLGLRSRLDYSSSWNVYTDCCEWEGVYCNSSTGRVVRLFSYYFDKQYINYSDFSVFKDLKYLSFSYNIIVGCVGDAELPNLQLLEMFGNKLDTAASIISCLDGLPSLKYLYLRDNGLNTSSLNHVFGSVSPKLRSNLEVLDLSFNNFNNTDIGSALSGLSSLNSLYLGGSKLSWRSIYNISKLSSLENLYLEDNYLNESESIFYMLRPLKENETFKWPINLQYLDMSSNSLSNGFLSYLRDLPYLQFLDLSYNQLEEAVDITGLSTLSNLTNLYLRDNNIHSFVTDQGLKGLNRLDVLDLDWNMIDGNKLRESLRALSSSIRDLSISYNYFKGTILAKDFHDLSNLERLKLDGNNHMKNEFFESIGNLTSLKALSLSYCHINDTLPEAGKFLDNILGH